MLDFDKFKKSMLDCKKGMVNSVEATTEESKDNLPSFEEFLKMYNEPLDKANGWNIKVKSKEYKNGLVC